MIPSGAAHNEMLLSAPMTAAKSAKPERCWSDERLKHVERHTLTVLVDNEAGVLARVVGLFSGRGYNIESLTVAEVDPTARTSRITIVTSGTPAVIEQIEAQLQPRWCRCTASPTGPRPRPGSSAKWR